MVESRPGLRAISYSAPEAIGTEPFVEARWDGLSVRTRLVGDYNRSNIAAAIAVGLYFGIGRAEIVSAIESYDPDNNRSQKRQTAFNTLISDCYNANPSSMQAALDNFLREADPRPKAVVLGDMGELGPYAAVEHGTVIERLEQGGIEEAYLVGGHFAEATRKRSPDIWTSIRSVTGSYSSKARARIVWKRSPRSCNRKQESPFGSLRDRTAHDPHFREHCQLRPYRTCGTATAHAVPPPPRRKICRPNDKCPAQTYGSASDLRPPRNRPCIASPRFRRIRTQRQSYISTYQVGYTRNLHICQSRLVFAGRVSY